MRRESFFIREKERRRYRYEPTRVGEQCTVRLRKRENVKWKLWRRKSSIVYSWTSYSLRSLRQSCWLSAFFFCATCEMCFPSSSAFQLSAGPFQSVATPKMDRIDSLQQFYSFDLYKREKRKRNAFFLTIDYSKYSFISNENV